MSKQEIIDKLTELGIDHDPKAKVADLKALLPADGPESDGVATPVVVEGYHVVEVENDDAAAVYNGSVLIRTYSEEVHGSEYLELAEKFVRKNSQK